MMWVDAHLFPALARWITSEFGHSAKAVRAHEQRYPISDTAVLNQKSG
jgi:predicted nuclease of predicted toxin-antitoxin system